VSFGQIAGFFLDSCVLLPQSLASSREVCQKFLDETKDCFISQSVKDEVMQLSNKTCDTVITCIRHYMKPVLLREGLTSITRNNALVVANVFFARKKADSEGVRFSVKC
jgi:hypothetical protein